MAAPDLLGCGRAARTLRDRKPLREDVYRRLLPPQGRGRGLPASRLGQALSELRNTEQQHWLRVRAREESNAGQKEGKALLAFRSTRHAAFGCQGDDATSLELSKAGQERVDGIFGPSRNSVHQSNDPADYGNRNRSSRTRPPVVGEAESFDVHYGHSRPAVCRTGSAAVRRAAASYSASARAGKAVPQSRHRPAYRSYIRFGAGESVSGGGSSTRRETLVLKQARIRSTRPRLHGCR
jgi:hypothetical protein